MTSPLLWVALGVGAGCGAVLRFLVDAAVTRGLSTSLPVGTLAVNLTGCLALGVIDGAAFPQDVGFVLGTGVVGAYTTFSTWMFETQRLAEERQLVQAYQNVVVSLLLGIGVGAAGLWLGGRL
jgi:CrcB protein